MPQPHVTLVSWGFPPFRGSGTFRPLALCNALAAAGARVTVISAARETFLIHYGADTALEGQIDPRVTVRRVPFYPENAWPVINDWGPERAGDPVGFTTARNKLVPSFPEKVYDTWLPRATQALRQLHADDPLSLIIGTGSPYGDLEAAVTVGSDNGIPVVLDDRDSFLADVFTAVEHPLYDKRLPFASRWFRTAAEVWFVNPAIAQWHVARFPETADRFVVVENGWDPGTVEPSLVRESPGQLLRVGYVGLIPTNFPMSAVLTAWERVRSTHGRPMELVFTGPLGYEVDSPTWRAMADRINDATGVHWQGHLSRTELAAVYADLDVLLLAKEGGLMVTGGKTYEYAATGLPIVGLVDPASDASRVLHAYPRFHPAATLDTCDAVSAMNAAVADACAGDPARVRAAQQFGASLGRSTALTPAVERILGLAGA